jgi:hypothetical protein
MLGSMRTAKRYTFTIALLTALGVLPVPAEAAQNRPQAGALGSLDLEGAAVIATAVKQVRGDIRAGRLGH